MLSLDDIITALSSRQELLRGKYAVKRIGVFGSYARGDQTDSSDIDFIVEFSEDVSDLFDIKYQLRNFLADLFHAKVDLANREAIKPYVLNEILKETRYAG